MSIKRFFQRALAAGFAVAAVLSAVPQFAQANVDTVSFTAPAPATDTFGGRRAKFTFRLNFNDAVSCTVAIEFDSDQEGTYFDSVSLAVSEGGPDTTPMLSTDTAGNSYTFTWNVRRDIPDTILQSSRMRIRAFEAATGAYLGDTILDTICLRTVLADAADTPFALPLTFGDTVRMTWKQDTYSKYFMIWRDTGWPANDTDRFTNVIQAVRGNGVDSVRDAQGLLFHDTAVGPRRTDTYFVWYITGVDTWNNQHEFQYGYGDSIGAEFLFVKKHTLNITTRGVDTGETKPGAAIFYHIDVSNTQGYSPAYNVSVIDYIPSNTDYKDSSVQIDTRYEFIGQTDGIDTDYTRFVPTVDSQYLKIDFPFVFNPGDTARIRFRVIIK